MRRFVEEALPLGKEAVSAALDAAGLAASDVGLFGVVSCTGYATPGLDILLARDLGMSADVQRLSSATWVATRRFPGSARSPTTSPRPAAPAVMLCLELTSLHVQPPTASARWGRLTDDLQQMVAHALFTDAAAAVVVAPAGRACRWSTSSPAPT